jgi:hypothetical protein
MKADIKLNVKEIEQIIREYVHKQVGTEPTAIRFTITDRSEGDYRDSWKVSELTEAVVTVDLKV